MAESESKVPFFAFFESSKCPSSQIDFFVFSVAAVSILSFATYIPAIQPITKIINRLTKRYLLQSPFNSLGTRLINGFFVLFFFIPFILLPFQIHCRNLLLIDIIVSDTSITQLNHMICHMTDCLIMSYHNNGISVFFVYIFNQFQNFF